MGDLEAAAIRSAFRLLLPDGVAVSVGCIAGSSPTLDESERRATARMSPPRLREFAQGRAEARAALGALGAPSGPVPIGADRAPIWPPGYVGSISHAGDIAVAVAAARGQIAAIGVDLEPAVPLEPELLQRVCRPEELARLRAVPNPALHAKLIFSAKESVYKCIAPVLGLFLEFADLEIVFSGTGKGFHAVGHGPAQRHVSAKTIEGAWSKAGGYLLTGAWQRRAR